MLAHLFDHRQRGDVAVGIALHFVGALQELDVRHDLLHRADVDLARAQAGRAHLLDKVLAMGEVFSLEIERVDGFVQQAPQADERRCAARAPPYAVTVPKLSTNVCGCVATR